MALGAGFLLITALWFVAAFVLRAYIPTLESRGLFGDSYGALNALFSGLAFAGVAFALLQQNESRDQQTGRSSCSSRGSNISRRTSRCRSQS